MHTLDDLPQWAKHGKKCNLAAKYSDFVVKM